MCVFFSFKRRGLILSAKSLQISSKLFSPILARIHVHACRSLEVSSPHSAMEAIVVFIVLLCFRFIGCVFFSFVCLFVFGLLGTSLSLCVCVCVCMLRTPSMFASLCRLCVMVVVTPSFSVVLELLFFSPVACVQVEHATSYAHIHPPAPPQYVSAPRPCFVGPLPPSLHFHLLVTSFSNRPTRHL